MMPKAVSHTRGDALRRIFGHRDKVLIGVVHLLPLPGAPDYAAGGGVAAIYARALADARAYAVAGFDGLIVENHGDIPFAKPDDIGPETTAHMAVASDGILDPWPRCIGRGCWPSAPGGSRRGCA